MKKIFLPDGVQRLSLSGVPDSELQIMGPLDRELDIELSLDSSKFDDWGAAIAGLRVRRLRLTGVEELDLAAVAGLFGEITALSVQGKPGFLVNFEGLRQMKRLRTLSFGDRSWSCAGGCRACNLLHHFQPGRACGPGYSAPPYAGRQSAFERRKSGVTDRSGGYAPLLFSEGNETPWGIPTGC